MSEPQPPPGTPSHTLSLSAAPADIDELGHVSNIVYVRWVQEAAIAHAAAIGWDRAAYQALGSWFVIRRHEIDYVSSVLEGEAIDAVTWVQWWKNASSERRTVIRRRRDGAVVARAATLWAFVDLATGRLRRIPDEVRGGFGGPSAGAPPPA